MLYERFKESTHRQANGLRATRGGGERRQHEVYPGREDEGLAATAGDHQPRLPHRHSRALHTRTQRHHIPPGVGEGVARARPVLGESVFLVVIYYCM